MEFSLFIRMIGPSPNGPAKVLAGIVAVICVGIWYGPLFGQVLNNSLYKAYKAEGRSVFYWRLGIQVILLFLCFSLIAYYIKTDLLNTHNDQIFYVEHYDKLYHHIIKGLESKSFCHGLIHGVQYSTVWVVPFYIILTIVERKGFANGIINVIFWIIVCGIIGGIVDVWY